MTSVSKKPAKHGLDFVLDIRFNPVIKTRHGWQQYIDRYAAKLSKRDHLQYIGHVWESPAYIRVSVSSNYKGQ